MTRPPIKAQARPLARTRFMVESAGSRETNVNCRRRPAISRIRALKRANSTRRGDRHTHCTIAATMDAPLTSEELDWLGQLDTDGPIKREVPAPVGKRLVDLGLAITLVEGGWQLTALGRERLSEGGSAGR